MTDAHHLRRCSDDEIESLLAAPGTVVVEFSTEWCTPCLLLKPVAAKLALEFQEVATFVAVDADETERFKVAHDLTEFPQLLVFHDGVLVDRRIGHDSADNAAIFMAQALKSGRAGLSSDADRLFAVAAASALDGYTSSTASLEAEVNGHMDAVAPVMDALEEALKAEQASGALDNRGAMQRRSAEWSRVSAPFRDKLDQLNEVSAAALATYQASMAEAVEAYAAARSEAVRGRVARPVGQVCGPNDLFCRLRLGAA